MESRLWLRSELRTTHGVPVPQRSGWFRAAGNWWCKSMHSCNAFNLLISVQGVLSDCFHAEQRGKAISIYSLAPLVRGPSTPYRTPTDQSSSDQQSGPSPAASSARTRHGGGVSTQPPSSPHLCNVSAYSSSKKPMPPNYSPGSATSSSKKPATPHCTPNSTARTAHSPLHSKSPCSAPSSCSAPSPSSRSWRATWRTYMA